MIGDRRMHAALIGAHVGGHPFAVEVHLNAGRREPEAGGVADERAVRGRLGRRLGGRDAEHPMLELDLGELVGLASVDSAGARSAR
jgi:hypothetical protein